MWKVPFQSCSFIHLNAELYVLSVAREGKSGEMKQMILKSGAYNGPTANAASGDSPWPPQFRLKRSLIQIHKTGSLCI